MKFYQLFKISSYGLMLTGFLALAFTGAVELTGILLYALVLLCGWWWEDRKNLIPARAQNLLILAYLAFYVIDLGYFSRPLLATVHLLFFVSAIKLFSRKSARDYLFLYLFSLAQLLIAATFTVNLLFLADVCLFVLFGIGCLMLHEIFSSRQNMAAAVSDEGPSWSILAFLGNTLLVTAAVLVLSIPFFLILPRFPAGFMRGGANAGALSGFSDHVNLGDIGRIQLSSAVVMRVKVNRPLDQIPVDLKWRGISLAHFDGYGWSHEVGYHEIPANPSGAYRVASEPYRVKELLQQVVVVEASSPNILFHAPHLISVSNEVQELATDAGGNFFYRRPFSWGGKYTLFSAMVPREKTLARLLQPGPRPEAPSRYLALPEIDSRIGELADQVTGGTDDAAQKALLIERYLKSHYRYSLDLNFPRGVDPLAYFMFTAKAGHCEFFATAEAVMLRKLGIASRVVNGFRRGEFNEWGDDFIVRQSDAHSWVEAYFPGAGWVEFDPTPGGQERPSSAWLASLNHLFDAVDLYWTTEIVTYDFWKQVAVFRTLRGQLDAVSQRVDRWASGSWRTSQLTWALLKTGRPEIPWNWVFGSAAAAALGWLAFRFRLSLLWLAASLVPRGRSSQVETLLVTRCYLRFLRKLERRGFRRRRGETAQELVARIEAGPLRSAAAGFTELYYRMRYGGDPSPDLQTLITALDRV